MNLLKRMENAMSENPETPLPLNRFFLATPLVTVVLVTSFLAGFWLGKRDVSQAPKPQYADVRTMASSGVMPTVVAPEAPKPDPMSAAELVKKHPALQKVCDAVGGCDKVKISCVRYDGSGNDNTLRNRTFWNIEAGDAMGAGYYQNGDSAEGVLERAVASWFYWWKLEKEYGDQPAIVDPKGTPCDQSCLTATPRKVPKKHPLHADFIVDFSDGSVKGCDDKGNCTAMTPGCDNGGAGACAFIGLLNSSGLPEVTSAPIEVWSPDPDGSGSWVVKSFADGKLPQGCMPPGYAYPLNGVIPTWICRSPGKWVAVEPGSAKGDSQP